MSRDDPKRRVFKFVSKDLSAPDSAEFDKTEGNPIWRLESIISDSRRILEEFGYTDIQNFTLVRRELRRNDQGDSAAFFAAAAAAAAEDALVAITENRADDAALHSLNSQSRIIIAGDRHGGLEKAAVVGHRTIETSKRANDGRTFEADQEGRRLLAEFESFKKDHMGAGSAIRAFTARRLGKTSVEITRREYSRNQKALSRAKKKKDMY